MNKYFAMMRVLIASGVFSFPLFFAAPAVGAKTQSLGELKFIVAPRIITPNKDSANDKIFFRFDDSSDLTGLPLETGVFDINGARVAELHFDSDQPTFLTWDGRDESGRSVPSGIYIYSIKIGKNLATGTVVVAR